MDAMTAAEALARLKRGNERFRQDRAEAAGRDIGRSRELVNGQHPFAAVLCCSDSRVAPEILFDTGLGDLFVVRVAGNVASSSAIGSLEFAVTHLGVRLVAVLAHESCGAVAAVVKAAESSSNLEDDLGTHRHLANLCRSIQPVLELSGEHSVDAVARANARYSVDNLVNESEPLRVALESEQIEIVAGFYQFTSGKVEFD